MSEINEKIKEVIFKGRKKGFQFREIKEFEEKLKRLRHPESRKPLKELFGSDFKRGEGRDNLYRDIKSGELPKYAKDRHVKGLYIWFHDGKPFYVGISGKIAKRLHQHINNQSHYSASMAYKIANLVYGFVFDEEHDDGGKQTRAKFSKKHIAEIQKWMKEQEVAYIEIDDNDELALFEIFCAMKLDTALNSFQTT